MTTTIDTGHTLDLTNAAPAAPTGRAAGKVGGWAGIAFALLYAVGMGMAFIGPELTDAEKKDPDALSRIMHDWYSKTGNRVNVLVGVLLLGLAVLALLVFVNELRERLTTAGSNRAANLAFAGAILFAATTLVGAAANAWIPGMKQFGGLAVPNGEITYAATQLGVGIALIGAGMATALMLTTGGWGAAHTKVLPGWLGWAGVVIGVVLVVGSLIFLPMILLSIWALIAGIVLIRRPAPVA